MDFTGLIIDGVLVVLLAAVLVACLRVNRRLTDIRKGQTELSDIAARLESSTDRAKEAISLLKQESSEAEEALGLASKKARALADELTLITEAGDNLANRLEQKLTGRASEDETANQKERTGRPDLLKALKEAR